MEVLTNMVPKQVLSFFLCKNHHFKIKQSTSETKARVCTWWSTKNTVTVLAATLLMTALLSTWSMYSLEIQLQATACNTYFLFCLLISNVGTPDHDEVVLAGGHFVY